MRKKWKRNKNRIFLGILAFVCTFTQFAPTVNAAAFEIEMPFDEPTQSDYAGYVNLLIEEVPSSWYGVYTLCWNVYVSGRAGSQSISCGVNSNRIWFSVVPDTISANTGYFSLVLLSSSGFARTLVADTFVSSDGYDYTFSPTQFAGGTEVKIHNVQAFGNVSWLASDLAFNFKSFVVLWGGDGVIYGSLSDMLVLLEALENAQIESNLKLAIIQDKIVSMEGYLSQIINSTNIDKPIMDNFEQNSSSQSSQLGQLNQENKVDKIDINNASTTVDSNIDLNAVGSSGVVLSSLTGHQKILTMLLGVTAISLIAYVFFGKR